MTQRAPLRGVTLSSRGAIVINLNESVDNFDLFAAVGSPVVPVGIVVYIGAIEIGSSSTSVAGFVFGSGWHVDSRIKIFVAEGAVLTGKGGQGATGEGASNCGAVLGVAPTAGGDAIDATGLPAADMVEFTNLGTIAAPGGGGGIGGAGCVPGNYQWSGGGGGSGRGKTSTTGGPPGTVSGTPATHYLGNTGGTGTVSAPGFGGRGGNYPGSTNDSDRGGHGGEFATAGGSGQAAGAPFGAGAAAGRAIVGDSNINFLVEGTILGVRTG